MKLVSLDHPQQSNYSSQTKYWCTLVADSPSLKDAGFEDIHSQQSEPSRVVSRSINRENGQLSAHFSLYCEKMQRWMRLCRFTFLYPSLCVQFLARHSYISFHFSLYTFFWTVSLMYASKSKCKVNHASTAQSDLSKLPPSVVASLVPVRDLGQ